MSTNTMIDILGWIGALLVTIAFFLVSTRRAAGDSLRYQLLNLIGGVLLIINTVFYGAYPSSVVNLVWVGIAVYAIYSGSVNKSTKLPPPTD
jgi:hypothetical protein